MFFDLRGWSDKKAGVNNCKTYLHVFTLFVSHKYDNFAFSYIELDGIDQDLLPFA
jgi:hypothetical protein